MADIKNLRKWRNGDIINARDYVYERDAIVAEITGQSSFYVNVVDSLPTDLATGDHNNKYYLVRGGPDSKLFKIVNNIAVQHFVETYLDNLEDVIISSQTSRDVLMFKNGAWRNSPDVANDIDSLIVKGFVLEDAINLVAQNLQNHINNLSNPHNVTKQQVGLGNVDNTSDENKPVSNPTQLEIDKQVPRSFLDVPNGIPVLDASNKIQVKNLPDMLFEIDGLAFAGVLASDNTLKVLVAQLNYSTRSHVGLYWVATTTVTLTSTASTAPPFFYTEYYKTLLIPSDEGVIQQDGVTLTTTLEAGDWIVITKKDGAGTQANPYVYHFAVVNNTYEDASSALKGIVTLSSSTSTATISNNVITDSVLKDLITTETGVANKISASQHTHPISEVDDLQTELDDLNTAVEGKAEEVHTHVKADITDFAHTHAISEVNGLQTALDGKAEEVHTHVKADITDFAHTHAAGDIVSGTLSSSVLASGVADETTFLRGDGVWAPLTGEGGGGVLAGAGVANQIAYFTASDVVSSLSTTTYPSLTELSYVKGVTVPIQDHIDDESNPHNVTVAQINAEPANANIQAHISSTSNPHSVTVGQIGAEPAFTKNTAFNKDFGSTAGTVTEGNDPRLSDARTPLPHTHVSADITDLKENLKYLYIYGKAQSAITKGQAVQFAGVQGDHILLKPAVPSEINTNPDYFVGLAETTLASEDFGYVLTHGELSGINTSSYTEGAILWFASAGSTAGALTQTEPTGLNARIQVAAVNRTNPGNGIIFVRVHNVGVQVQDIVASGTRSASTFLNGEGEWAAPSTEGFVYGNGTANQLTYFTGSTEVASLDTATYPSLTEVSYVKGVTSAIQTQLNSKANLASPELTGTPLAPTATSGTNTTQIATTAFVSTAVANLINSAPGALDTLDELAQALGDDSNFASTVTTALAGKSPVGHPHSTADITTGIFSPSRLGTGTYSGVTFLNGLGQYVSVTNELGEGFLPLAGGVLTGPITLPATGSLHNLRYNFTSGQAASRKWFVGNDVYDYGTFNIATETAQGNNTLLSRFHINADGNVGIGTTGPVAKLHLVGTGNSNSNAIIHARDNVATGSNTSYGAMVFTSSPGSDFFIGKKSVNSSGYFVLGNANTSADFLSIDGSGNVGIGTTSPSAKLEILGPNISTPGTIKLSVPGQIAADSVLGNIDFQSYYAGNGTGTWGRISVVANAQFSNSGVVRPTRMVFSTTSAVSGATLSEKMRITPEGNVLIGTNTPGFPDGGGLVVARSSDARIELKNSSSGTASTDGGGLHLDGNTLNLVNRESNAILAFRTGASSAERMRIESSGYVGIGTTNLSAGVTLAVKSVGLTAQRWVYDESSYYLDLKQTVTSGNVRWNFSQRNNNVNYNDVLVLDTGKVGIGTAYPAEKLDVAGQIKMTGSAFSGNLGFVQSSWGGNLTYPTLYGSSEERWIMHINPHVSYTQSGVNGYSGSMTGATIRMAAQPAASQYWDVGIGTNGVGVDKFSIGRVGTPLFNIDNSGNVGIGTTSPIAKLHVAGDAAINNTTLGVRSNSTAYGGNTAGLSLNSVAELRSPQASGAPALTFHYENLATRHIVMNSVGLINVVAPSTENSGVATLAVNSNMVIHNGNLENVTQINSGSDFPNGTLVYTDIGYNSFSGDSFQIEIEGKSYGQVYPWMVRGQGYIYNNTIINEGYVDYTGNFPALTAFNFNGFLCFWWARQSYWNSFSVKVWSSSTYGGLKNRAYSIIDSGIPPSRTREVSFPRLRVWNNSNLTISTSTSTLTINVG
jgi:hypothetical protein